MSRKEEDRAPYLSRSEGPRLELKSAAAVDDPLILPRAVCGLLNARGGHIIVGVREVGGARAPDAVTEPSQALRVTIDRLAASLEPSPPASLKVEALTDRHGGWLRIRVPRGKVLYAVRERHGGFAVLRRVGDRQVPLAWPEIEEGLSRRAARRRTGPERGMDAARRREPTGPARGARGETGATWARGRRGEGGGRAPRGDALGEAAAAQAGLERWMLRAQKTSRPLREKGGLLLWMEASEPATGVDERAWRNRVGAWIADPAAIGIRRLGWHYGALEGRLSRVRGGGGPRWLRSGSWSAGYRATEVSPAGALRFATALDHIEEPLRARAEAPTRPGRLLNPCALIETVASCATLFAKVLEASGIRRGSARAGLALTRIRDWSLRPGRPGTLEYEIEAHRRQPPYPEDSLQANLSGLSVRQIRREPHRLAWMLVRQVYASFGYDEGDIPLHDGGRGVFFFE